MLCTCSKTGRGILAVGPKKATRGDGDAEVIPDGDLISASHEIRGARTISGDHESKTLLRAVPFKREQHQRQKTGLDFEVLPCFVRHGGSTLREVARCSPTVLRWVATMVS